MLRSESFPIDKIYVPVKRRKDLNDALVQELAESILENGQQTPILVRVDEDRFVLVEGLHRLEACRALGEQTIVGHLVSARAAQEDAPPPREAKLGAEREKMERLRKLRLEKEAAEKLAAVAGEAASHAAHDDRSDRLPRTRDTGTSRPRGKAPRAASPSLSEWLANRERDGFRN